MNRTQKKCFVGVALLHTLPLVIAIIGTAFFNKPTPDSTSPTIIELIPDNAVITDGPTGGGTPAVAPAPEPIPVPVVKPLPVVPKPTPEPEPEPEPPKPVVDIPTVKPVEKQTVSELPVPKKETKTKPTPEKPEKTVTKPAPVKRNIDISKPTVLNTKEKQASAQAAQRAAEQKARDQRVSALNSSLKNIGKRISEPTSFESGGSGGSGGGQAEINYGDLVLKKYDDAWIAPSEVDDDVAVAKARVVIGRNGNVISSEVIKGSGNAILDKSVRRALDSVRFIAPFPTGSGDSQRTYIINFNLKSKRGIG